MPADTTPADALKAVRDTLSTPPGVGAVLRFRDAARRLVSAAAASPASVPMNGVADALAAAFERHAGRSSGAASLFGVDAALADAYHACLVAIELSCTVPGCVDGATAAWRTVLESLPEDVDLGVRVHALAAAAGLGGAALHATVADELARLDLDAPTATAGIERCVTEAAAHLARTTPTDGDLVARLCEVGRGEDALAEYWRSVATLRARGGPTDRVVREEPLASGLDGIFDGTTTPSGIGDRLQFGRAVGALPPAARALTVRHGIEAGIERATDDDAVAKRIGTGALWGLLTDAGRDPRRAPVRLARVSEYASLFGFGTETPRALGTGVGLALRSLRPSRRRQAAAAVVELFDPESDCYLLAPPPTDRMNASWTASPRDLYRFLEAIATTVDDDGTRRVLAAAVDWGTEHSRRQVRTAAVEAAVALRERAATGSPAAGALDSTLEDVLHDGGQSARETAVDALVAERADESIPEWARGVLLQVLDAPECERRLDGARALAEMADELPAAVRRRVVERVTTAAATDGGTGLSAIESCCRTLGGAELERVASVAAAAVDQPEPPVEAVDAISALAANDAWTASTATVERVLELAVHGDATPVRASAAGALEAMGSGLEGEGRERVLANVRALTFGVPAPVRRAGASLAGRLVDAVEAEFVLDCLHHHDDAVADAFVAAVRDRSGASTASVALPGPAGVERLLRRALENGHRTTHAVVVGTRSLDELTATERTRYVAVLTDVLTDGGDDAGRAALVEHALGIVREDAPSTGGSWSPALKGLAEAVVDRLRAALRSDERAVSRSAVRVSFEDALPVIGFADREMRASLTTAAQTNVKARQAMYEQFPALYDALSAERGRDWLAFLVDLPVDSERTPHALVQCLPALAERPSVDDSTLRTLLAQVAAEVTPEEWPDSRETPGTHVVEHLYELLERRPRAYESFPTLREHVLATADTTGVEYVSALLEFETLAVQRSR